MTLTPPITAWAIKAPEGHILVDTIRATMEHAIEDKILAPWEFYESRGYRCVRVNIIETDAQE